ncbi:MAG: aminotransferase class V-fold PLP-dependent enzyme [Bacillota bacterium]|nr:aminotransferase class V-fold PLP-dependent enzyme [Bacillota bacterium]
MIYLDSAATSFLKPPSVERAMVRAMHTMASPGRGSYTQAMRASNMMYECRELAGELFNFENTERIVFTSNATHSLNIAIRTMARSGDKVVISGYEHNSVTRVLQDIGARVIVAEAPLFDSEAAIKSFESRLDGAKLVVCNHISNVFGFVQPIYGISELCQRKNIPLIVDASQSAGVCEIDTARLKAAFIAMPGHKGLLGPQGTGILLCGDEPVPILFGGTGSDSIVQTMPDYLPDLLEAGTHNIPGIAGLSEGIRFVLKETPAKIGEYERYLCRRTAERLKNIDELEIFSTELACQTGVLSVRHTVLDSENLCEKLGKRGIACRCGLHCAPIAHKTAGTIDTGTLRISFSPFNSEKEVLTAVNALEKIIVHKK